MSALQSQGLIEIRHGSGAYLVESEPGQLASDMAEALIDSSRDLPYVMETRFAIEPFITGLAAERGTESDVRAIRAALNTMEREIAAGESGETGDIAFHAAIMAAAHNPTLAEIMARLQPDMARLREEALAQPTTPRLALDAHHAILEAIESGDRERAFRAAHQHLVDAAEALLVSEVGTRKHALLAEVLVSATGSAEVPEQRVPEVARGLSPAVLAATLSPALPFSESAESVRNSTGHDSVLRLDTTDGLHGCSPLVSAAINKAAQEIADRPDPEASALRGALASHLGVQETQLIFGNGSDEVLQLVARTFLSPGRSAAASEPTYAPYRTHTYSAGANFSSVRTEGGGTDLVALISAAANASLIWICNPNTPTGAYLRSDELRQILSAVPHDVVVVLDEALAEYSTAADFPDSVPLIQEFPNLIVTRTFSGAHGLAGLRIGYGVASPRVANLINTLRSPFNTSTVAQAAACAAIADEDFVRNVRERNAQGRERVEEFCRAQGFDHFPSQANFVLLEVPGGAEQACKALKKQGLLVASGASLGFPSRIRMSIGTEDQITDALLALSTLN